MLELFLIKEQKFGIFKNIKLKHRLNSKEKVANKFNTDVNVFRNVNTIHEDDFNKLTFK